MIDSEGYPGVGRVLVVIPTYNEAENIRLITDRVRRAVPSVDILVADDNSPDGTGGIADEHVVVEVTPDRLVASVGTQSQGQGHQTVFAQILSAALGVPVERIEVRQGDTRSIPHGGGTSYSVFRFATVSGTLTVDVANPNNSKVMITVDPKSITSNVAGFGDELAGERYLNSAKFPTATFTSTGVKASGAKADVTGDLMLMGQTKPVTAHMELVGSGQARGKPVVGFTGTAKFKRSDFGFTALMGPIGDDV